MKHITTVVQRMNNLFEKDFFPETISTAVCFINDPIALALYRTDSGARSVMVDLDADPETAWAIARIGYDKQAAEIREFYKKKLFLGYLTDSFVKTKFRDALAACLNRPDIHTLEEREIGMIARLPNFFQEDRAMEMIASTCDVSPISVDELNIANPLLKFITTTTKWYGTTKTTTYWFKMQNNRVASFAIESSNPLINLFDQFIETADTVSVGGTFFTKSSDTFHYYTCTKPIILV